MNLTNILKKIIKYTIVISILIIMSWYMIRGSALLLGENFKQF